MSNSANSGVKADVEADTKPKVELDSILVNEIGQFGRFQLKTFILTAIVAIFVSWSANEYIFTTSRINSRCVIPECDGDQPEWSPYWLSNAVPSAGSNSFDNCQRYGNMTILPRQVESDTCPSTLFDRDILQQCEEYVYENNLSVAYDFDLACDEWRRTLIAAIRPFGTFVALPLTGYVSDRWGRRVAVTLSAFNTGWIGLIRYWSNSYSSFISLEFIEATFGAGSFSSAYILLMELVGPKYRVAAGAAMNTSFAVGQTLMGLIAWAVPHWRNLTLALYVPQLITLAYFWVVSESVRWYMSKGRFDESEAVLHNVAKTNGKKLSEKSLQALRNNAEEEARNRALEKQSDVREPWLIVKIFRHKRILLRCIVSPVWWITTTFIYYGLSLNVVNMSGNRYLNYIAISVVEIPGYWTSFLLMGRIGRKPVLIGGFWMCAVCQIAYIFMPQGLYTVSLVIYLAGKYSIAIVMTALYVYTAELYPTRHRHTLYAFSLMVGRLGVVIATLTPAIAAQWFEALPFVLFGSFALVSGALVFLTPETLNTKFPDTLEEASEMGLRNDNIEK